MKKTVLIGPFRQIVPLADCSLRGPLMDSDLQPVADGGILVTEGKIVEINDYRALAKKAHQDWVFDEVDTRLTAVPGWIDPHTHIAFTGTRSADFARRLEGMSYLEIAKQGGGIWSTVEMTRKTDQNEMVQNIKKRAERALRSGVTTIEVKSGYGLDVETELRLLRSIAEAGRQVHSTLIPTCLAAHTQPRDFDGSKEAYLDMCLKRLAPVILKESLTSRMDVFIEKEAFTVDQGRNYLTVLKSMGFDLTIHGDQFSTGGSALGVELGARSVDHLEASTETEIDLLASSQTVATILPGASLGLGCNFGPARKLLDRGAIVAIGSDWNPGSAPMGDLLTAASILATYEKLTVAEILAGITFRAAYALGLNDRGRLCPGYGADIIGFPCPDFRDIVYFQGTMTPSSIWKSGNRLVDQWEKE